MSQLFGIPLGWIMWLLYKVIPSYGVVLILFTVLVKAALFPLSVKQQKSTAKMAVFQPKIDEINKKYANNKQKQQEEMMKLYEAHGYNPMSGCLPLLIQFPILFGIIDVVYKPLTHLLRIPKDVLTEAGEILKTNYQALGQAVGQQQLQIISEMHNPEHAQWFASLGSNFMDKVSNFDYSFFGLDLGQTPTFALNWLILVPILSGATSLFVSILSMKMSPNGQQQQGGMMKGMMYGMPLLSVLFAFSLPVGVGIYWIISNLLSGVQSVLLNKLYNPEKYKAEYQAKLEEEEAKRRAEREKRRQRKLDRGEELSDEDLTEEELKKKKVKTSARTEEEEKAARAKAEEEYLTAKEINRRRLAEARRQDAEKYGEEYAEVTDKDLQ